ncbi:MAG: BON domain-containing protein [Anaerolineales bacterium]|nr:BON domain-containing protein [Anaerolineales bacterium]
MAQSLKYSTDEKLRAAILAQFAADERVAHENLRVGVSKGIVHLAGAVSSIEIRTAAADLASKPPNVRGVVNRIEAPGAPSPGRTIHLNLSNEKENIDQ